MTERNENSAFVPVPETGTVVPTSGPADRIRELEAALAKAEGERDSYAADKERLDYLDGLSAALNAHYGTSYGWEFIVNHNVNRLYFKSPRLADLNDAAANGFKSCRAAIDDRLRRDRTVAQSIEKELGS